MVKTRARSSIIDFVNNRSEIVILSRVFAYINLLWIDFDIFLTAFFAIYSFSKCSSDFRFKLGYLRLVPSNGTVALPWNDSKFLVVFFSRPTINYFCAVNRATEYFRSFVSHCRCLTISPGTCKVLQKLSGGGKNPKKKKIILIGSSD